MLWFIIGAIFALIGLAILIIGPKTTTEVTTGRRDTFGSEITEKKVVSLRPTSLIFFFVALPFIIVSMISIVGPRNVGVEHVFNKTTGTNHEAGFVWKAPWVAVEDIDTRIQPEEYAGDSCIYVKIADGGRACITVSYSWRVNKDNSDDAFKDYGKGEDDIVAKVRSAITSPTMKAALNEEWGAFDPLDGAEITPDMSAQEIANIKLDVIPDYGHYNQQIMDNFNEKVQGLGGLVDLEKVTVSYIALPEETQERIDRIKNKVLDSKAALLDVATKDAQAQGNIALAESLQDPNVLVSKCLDGLISGDITNQPGFSCWGPSGAVVLPGASK